MGVSMWKRGEEEREDELSPKQNLFYTLRLVELLDNPVRDGEKPYLWHTRGRFQAPASKTEIKIRIFSYIPPVFNKGDLAYAVFRGKWELLADSSAQVIARVNSSKEITSNKWEYSLSVVNLSLSPPIEALASDTFYTGFNLYEIENLDTGLMGNGLDISALTIEGADSYLAPVPSGTLVVARVFKAEKDAILLFQYCNQIQYPFASHLTATLSDPIDYGQTGTVNVGGSDIPVSCPLLRYGESIPADTEVIVSRNLKTGRWEIIEAQCPATPAETAGDSGEDVGGQSEDPEDGE